MPMLAGCNTDGDDPFNPEDDDGVEPAGGQGELVLEVTDAPFDHSIVERAVIRVSDVRILDEREEGEQWVDVYDGEPLTLDLLQLRNGITQRLLQARLDAGSYRQMRLVVDAAALELVNGNVYSTDDGSLKLTSQDTSGFKVFFDPPVEIVEENVTRFLLDVSLEKTFKPVPASDPLAATRYQLHPVIRAANLGAGGEIRGFVFRAEDDGSRSPAGGAVVFVLPPGETDLAAAVASTATEADGTFAVLGVDAGSCDVYARAGDVDARVDAQAIESGAITVVEVTMR